MTIAENIIFHVLPFATENVWKSCQIFLKEWHMSPYVDQRQFQFFILVFSAVQRWNWAEFQTSTWPRIRYFESEPDASIWAPYPCDFECCQTPRQGERRQRSSKFELLRIKWRIVTTSEHSTRIKPEKFEDFEPDPITRTCKIQPDI